MFLYLAIGRKRQVLPPHLQFCNFCHFRVLHLSEILPKELIVLPCSSAVVCRDQQEVQTNQPKAERKSWGATCEMIYESNKNVAFYLKKKRKKKAEHWESVKHLTTIFGRIQSYSSHVFFFQTWTTAIVGRRGRLSDIVSFFAALKTFEGARNGQI